MLIKKNKLILITVAYKQQYNIMGISLIREGVSKNTDFANGQYY